jgi:hypothetical protein
MGVGVSFIMLLRGHLSLSENHFSRSEGLFSRVHGQKSIELETVVLFIPGTPVWYPLAYFRRWHERPGLNFFMSPPCSRLQNDMGYFCTHNPISFVRMFYLTMAANGLRLWLSVGEWNMEYTPTTVCWAYRAICPAYTWLCASGMAKNGVELLPFLGRLGGGGGIAAAIPPVE